jgi:Ca-activated chloride channel family protein
MPIRPNIRTPSWSCADRLDSSTVRGLWAAALALVVGLDGAAAGQFSSGVSLVEVYASVTDERGEPVRDLAREDFEVREDGVLQPLSAFAAGDFPLAVAVALDASFSMAGARLELARSAARTFVGELRPRDEAMVVSIGSQVEVAAPLSTDRRAQLDAVARIEAFGTTPLHDAIIQSIDAVQPAKGRRALLLLSDGEEKYSEASADAAIARARRSDVMVYPVALGRRRPELFAELATVTGGRSYHGREAKDLMDAVRAVARDLRHQYLLGYAPLRSIQAGREEWRSIEVAVKRPKVRVRARDGYLVR